MINEKIKGTALTHNNIIISHVQLLIHTNRRYHKNRVKLEISEKY